MICKVLTKCNHYLREILRLDKALTSRQELDYKNSLFCSGKNRVGGTEDWNWTLGPRNCHWNGIFYQNKVANGFWKNSDRTEMGIRTAILIWVDCSKPPTCLSLYIFCSFYFFPFAVYNVVKKNIWKLACCFRTNNSFCFQSFYSWYKHFWSRRMEALEGHLCSCSFSRPSAGCTVPAPPLCPWMSGRQTAFTVTVLPPSWPGLSAGGLCLEGTWLNCCCVTVGPDVVTIGRGGWWRGISSASTGETASNYTIHYLIG